MAESSAAIETMTAGVVEGPGQARIESVEIPVPGPGELRVQLEGSGVCGSILPVWEGRPWFSYPLPAGTPGHEGWGVVDAVGAGVDTVAVGQRVASLGSRAFAEYEVISADAVVPLPAALAGQAFPGEPIGCAVNVFRRSEIGAGDTVVIIGVGFLGAIVTRLASRAGARVIAMSRRPFALEVAGQQGADVVLSLDDPDAAARAVDHLTGGRGADRVVEAVGLQAPLDLAGRLTRIRGRLVIAGYHQDGPRQVDMQLWNWRGIDVINAHERDPHVVREGVRAGIAAVLDGTLELDRLFTHCFQLSQLGEALDTMRRRPDGFLKALVLA
jgi:threonine dehydrogenase-like Zn-dependent dehydrogenase